MPRKFHIFIVASLASLHLFIAALSSAKVSSWDYLGKGILGKVAVVYAYVSGVGNHYGFFAPGVLSQMRVDYVCYRGKDVLENKRFNTENSETRFRWHNLIENFWLSQNKEDVRRSQAASFAGKIFERCPKADSVSLSVKAFGLPSMAEYRTGKRPFWEEHYSGTFRISEFYRGETL